MLCCQILNRNLTGLNLITHRLGMHEPLNPNRSRQVNLASNEAKAHRETHVREAPLARRTLGHLVAGCHPHRVRIRAHHLLVRANAQMNILTLYSCDI